MPASVVAPMLTRPSFNWAAARRGARSSARAPRVISPGTVVRSSSASPSSFADPGSGRAVHGAGGRGVASGLGGGVEQNGGDVHPGDPVDERVVSLGDQREASPAMRCTSQISHSGLERSRRWENSRPASCFSAASSAGRGRAVWRMW